MKTAVHLLFLAVGIVPVLGFIVGYAAHLQLQFFIDSERLMKETGRSGARFLGFLTPPEFYIPEGRRMWKVRDIGFKTFAVGVGVLIMIAGVAAVVDVPLQ